MCENKKVISETLNEYKESCRQSKLLQKSKPGNLKVSKLLLPKQYLCD